MLRILVAEDDKNIRTVIAKTLQNAGFEVVVPRESFCCGRPLFDWGMIETAKKLLKHTLTGLSQEI